MSDARILVVQDRLDRGGRSLVTSVILRACMRVLGLDQVNFATASTDSEIQEFCALADCRVDELIRPTRRFNRTAVDSPIVQRIAQRASHRFDLVLTGNNLRGRFEAPTIDYCHFPYERGWSDVGASIGARLFRVMIGVTYRDLKTPPVTLGLTNSSYTQSLLCHRWRDYSVSYPPMSLDAPPETDADGSGIVSLGNLVPFKRHEKTMKLAERFPDHQFEIIGRSVHDRYTASLVEHANRLPNLRLSIDADREHVTEALRRARIYLHNAKNEHFGIAIAEAIHLGCLPIVPNRGGQVEHVDSYAGHVFEDAVEAEHLVKYWLSCPTEELQHRVRQLQRGRSLRSTRVAIEELVEQIATWWDRAVQAE